MATIFFSIQIYCDFSGYSDIACGSAKVLGFDLMKNFNKPYFSISFSDFWRRWHISLSTWFRDYLYVPLGGGRTGVLRKNFNLFFTFCISGLWHGASWTFVIWGALNGLLLVLENANILYLRSWKNKLLKWIFVYLSICVTWIFFRAENLKDALYILKSFLYFQQNPHVFFLSNEIVLGMLLILIFLIIEFFSLYEKIDNYSLAKPIWLNRLIYYLLILIIFALGKFTNNQFIYFQF